MCCGGYGVDGFHGVLSGVAPSWFWVVCLILVHVLFLFKFGNFVVGVGFSVIIFRFDFCGSNTPSNIQLKLKPKI